MRFAWRLPYLLAAIAAPCVYPQAQPALTDRAAAFFDDGEVREVRLYFDDPNWYNTLLRAHQTDPNDPYFPCRFRSGEVALEKIGCRFKGNSSSQRNGIKKPFKLDFNEYDPDANFLGLKKLNLHNFDLQPDFMREKLLLDLSGRYVAAMRAVYVRLYVNDAFYGLYLAVEQPDMTMMRSRWGAAEDGNLYEAEEQLGAGAAPRPNLGWLGSNQAAYERVYRLKSNEEKNDYSRLIQFLDILNNTPAAELPGKLEEIADVENWMLGMALNNLMVNLDSYLGVAAEYYIYDRTLDGRFVHIQWDNNETFGITGDGTPRLINPYTTDPFWLPTAVIAGPGGGGFPGGGGTAASTARPLLEKMWAAPEYRRLYLRSLARFLREGFTPEAMGSRVEQLATLIRAHVNEDRNKPYTAAQFEANLNTQVSNIPGVMQFVRERYNFLRTYLNGQGQAVDVRLNEVALNNAGTVTDEAGDADPWVEIHNLGPGPVSLDGFYLTEEETNPNKWALPAVTLADGEFLVVWLDGQTEQGANHANFRAPGGGGKLYLFADAVSATTPLDTVTVEALPRGQTQIRLGMHGARWAVTAEATPGTENRLRESVSPGTGLLLINEIMADNETAYEDPEQPGAYEDWFEIYNPGAESVDMSGMYLSDNPLAPTKWKVSEGIVVPPGGFVVFLADNQTSQGPRHAGFALSADGESLSLYDRDGVTLIDSVSFGAQKKDTSYGRTPDGGATWTLFKRATPGAPNAAGAR